MEDLQRGMRLAMADAADEASAYLRALSNPSRLMILCELLNGERNVGQLEKDLDLGQAYVSQQLARLRAEGLVSARKDGRIVYYSLSDGRVRPLIELLHSQFCDMPSGAFSVE